MGQLNSSGAAAVNQCAASCRQSSWNGSASSKTARNQPNRSSAQQQLATATKVTTLYCSIRYSPPNSPIIISSQILEFHRFIPCSCVCYGAAGRRGTLGLPFARLVCKRGAAAQVNQTNKEASNTDAAALGTPALTTAVAARAGSGSRPGAARVCTLSYRLEDSQSRQVRRAHRPGGCSTSASTSVSLASASKVLLDHTDECVYQYKSKWFAVLACRGRVQQAQQNMQQQESWSCAEGACSSSSSGHDRSSSETSSSSKSCSHSSRSSNRSDACRSRRSGHGPDSSRSLWCSAWTVLVLLQLTAAQEAEESPYAHCSEIKAASFGAWQATFRADWHPASQRSSQHDTQILTPQSVYMQTCIQRCQQQQTSVSQLQLAPISSASGSFSQPCLLASAGT